MTHTATTESQRLHYLDALRVFAMALLVIFHTGLVFTPFYNYLIHNTETSLDLALFTVALLHPWHMPMMFFIAGMSAHFSLRRRSIGQFRRERVERLFVPFLFGILLLVPPQVYFAMISRGRFEGPIWQFYGFYFTDGFTTGDFSWHHLWFILYLFTLSLIASPLLARWNTPRLAGVREWVARIVTRRGAILAGAVPLMITETLFRGRWPGYYNLVGDWANVSLFLLVFVYGFIALSDTRIPDAVHRSWRGALIAALGVTAVLLGVVKVAGERPALGYDQLAYYLLSIASGLNTWCWIVAMVGLAHALIRRPVAWIERAGPYTYPFYILHQTVLVAAAYVITQWEMAILLKFALIVAATFVGTGLAALILHAIPLGRVMLGSRRSADRRVRAIAPQPPLSRDAQAADPP